MQRGKKRKMEVTKGILGVPFPSRIVRLPQSAAAPKYSRALPHASFAPRSLAFRLGLGESSPTVLSVLSSSQDCRRPPWDGWIPRYHLLPSSMVSSLRNPPLLGFAGGAPWMGSSSPGRTQSACVDSRRLVLFLPPFPEPEGISEKQTGAVFWQKSSVFQHIKITTTKSPSLIQIWSKFCCHKPQEVKI